jgi:hypothetical protein
MTDVCARERLRQERETFDQAKAHNARWFTLRLRMGYAGIVLLFVIALVAGHTLLHPASYDPSTITIAATTLFVDMIGLVVTIFKLVLHERSAVALKPIASINSQTQ